MYRPRDLTPFGKEAKLPIVLWANGGGIRSSAQFRDFLTEIASHGFLVVAIGLRPRRQEYRRRCFGEYRCDRSRGWVNSFSGVAVEARGGAYLGKIGLATLLPPLRADRRQVSLAFAPYRVSSRRGGGKEPKSPAGGVPDRGEIPLGKGGK